jgi:hypothetical protein
MKVCLHISDSSTAEVTEIRSEPSVMRGDVEVCVVSVILRLF